MIRRPLFVVDNNRLNTIPQQLCRHHQSRGPGTNDQYFGMCFRRQHFYLWYNKKMVGRLCNSGTFFCQSAMVLVCTNSVLAVRSQAMQSLVLGCAVFNISSSIGLLRKGVSINICVCLFCS